MGRFSTSKQIMADQSKNRVDQILEDLGCPQCEYNLRGLVGEVVTCPECGHVVNVTQLVARRWTGSWMRAPGFSQLVGPVSLVAFSPLIFGCIAIGGLEALILGALVLFAVWIGLMSQIGMKQGAQAVL